MSLLLDALRRASASREDPKGEHYTLPRRGTDDPGAPAGHERPDAAPHDDSGAVRGADYGGDLGDELSLAPRDETQDSKVESGAPEGVATDERAFPAADPLQDDATRETATRASARERATADALLETGARGSRRGRAALVLGLSTAAVIATAALAGGGWLWYQQSREQIATELGRYRPAAVPHDAGEPGGESQQPGNAEAESLPALAEASATPGLEEAVTKVSDESANNSAADQASVADETSSSSETAAPEGEPENVEPAPGPESPAPESPNSTPRGGTNNSRPAETADSFSGRSDTNAADGDPASAETDPTSGSSSATSEIANASPPADPAEGGAPGTPARNSETAHRTPPANVAGAQAAGSASEQSRPTEPRRARPLIQVARGAPLSEALQIGYTALREGDLATAGPAYARALDLAPENRDALLGAAVLRQRQGSPDAARSLYQRVLDAHPRDPYARAALAALDGGATRRNESELKTLLREDPTAPALNFALGNVYASESRWAEARQAYARARDAAPEDPDYAYNLAVALDHLGRREAARAQYQQALRLADGARPEFRPGAVRRRVQQLR